MPLDDLKQAKQAQPFIHEGLELNDEELSIPSNFDLTNATNGNAWRSANNNNHQTGNNNKNNKTNFIANNNRRQAINHPPPYSNKIGSNNLLLRLFLAEFLGTFTFVYLGQCIITSFELSGTQSEASVKLFASLICQSVALLMSIWLTISVSGGHLNPAYTMASAAFGLMKWSQVPVYLLGQYGGSFLAACFIHITYNDKIAHRHAEGLLNGMNMTLRAHGNILSSGKFFTTFPPIEVSLTQLFISYTLATAQFSLLAATIYENHHHHHNLNHHLNNNNNHHSHNRNRHETSTTTTATCTCCSNSCFSSAMEEDSHHNNSATITNDDESYHHHHQHHHKALWQKNHNHLQHLSPPPVATHGHSIISHQPLPKYLQPVYLSLAWLVSQAAFSANGGPVLNPAADFSPRLYISISGWGGGSFNLYCFTYWWLCGLVAPHLGALVGLAVHRVVIAIHLLPYGSGGGGQVPVGPANSVGYHNRNGLQTGPRNLLSGSRIPTNSRFVGDNNSVGSEFPFRDKQHHEGTYQLNGNQHQQTSSSLSHQAVAEQQVSPPVTKTPSSDEDSSNLADNTITSQSPFLTQDTELAVGGHHQHNLNHHQQEQQSNMQRQDRQRASTATMISNISCGARSNVSNTTDNMRQHQKFLEKYHHQQQHQQQADSGI